jgi:hypothetical protein
MRYIPTWRAAFQLPERGRMQEFSPHLDVLPAAQSRLWTELSAVPKEFVLYDGTALALHLGHRQSVDFGFFASDALSLPKLEATIPFLVGARVIQREANTLTALVNRGGFVKVSFFGAPKLPRLAPPHTAGDIGLQVASLPDLAGTKASVLQMLAEAKDYVDIDALMRLGNVGLPTALAAAQKLYGPSFNPEITLKALSYFADGNLRSLSTDIRDRLAAAARAVDLDHLPAIDGLSRRATSDYGQEL